jgi:site-specific DNA-cytosine methylase
VDRLKAIGNSIVPQIAKKIGEAIIANEEERGQE